jgi:hypothetical protein
MDALTLMKTDTAGNFACNFTPYPLTPIIVPPPAVLNVPIYSVPQTTSVVNLATNIVTLNANQASYCLLFSTNDQPANTASISVYPSPVPAGENIYLATSGIGGDAIISVYDATGRVVLTYSRSITKNETIEISTAGFAPGMYLARITGTDQNLTGTSRFILR